jgi:type IV secretion system protein VirB2
MAIMTGTFFCKSEAVASDARMVRTALGPAGDDILAAADPLSRRPQGVFAAALFVITAVSSTPAFAAGSNMPWEQPLQQILQSIEGPVSKIIAVIIIIVTGLSLAFGDTAGGFRRLIQIVFGLSIAFAASSFFLSFFSFGGGVLVG